MTLHDIMDYELCSYPPALFDAKHVFLKADKPQLAEALRDFVSKFSSNAVITDSIPESEHFVLDGGSLLHRLSWKKGITYGEIANFTISKMEWLPWFLMDTVENPASRTMNTRDASVKHTR